MTIEEIKKGEHDPIEYKQDIPGDKDKYLNISESEFYLKELER